MIHLTAKTEILIATKPVDFRKQIDGLVNRMYLDAERRKLKFEQLNKKDFEESTFALSV